MRRLAYVLSAIAAFTAALLLVPPGTSGARPGSDAGAPVAFAVSADQQSLRVIPTAGSVKQVGDHLVVTNSRGAVTRVPLTVRAEGKTYPVKARVASDGKSAELKPIGYHQVLTTKRPLPKPKNAGQAWDQLNALANQNWGCAAGPTAIGAIIGALVGIFLILGWLITTPIGAAIGAYIGYDNCGRGRWGDKYRGETIRAFWTWWNMPGR